MQKDLLQTASPSWRWIDPWVAACALAATAAALVSPHLDGRVPRSLLGALLLPLVIAALAHGVGRVENRREQAFWLRLAGGALLLWLAALLEMRPGLLPPPRAAI